MQTITAVNSDSIDDYVAALRVNVCGQCDEQGADGLCRRREAIECALDRYFPLVIQVIEDTKAGVLATPG